MYLDMAITILKLVDVLGAFLDADNNPKTSLAIPFDKYFWVIFRSMFFYSSQIYFPQPLREVKVGSLE
jgi:hypothetical protein